MAYFAYLTLALITIYITAVIRKDSGVFTSLLCGLVIGILVGAGVISIKNAYVLNTITAERVNVVDPALKVKDASPTCTELPKEDDKVIFNGNSTSYMGQEQVLRDTIAGFDTERTQPPQEPEIQDDS